MKDGPSPLARNESGGKIGKYEIVGRIGSGGFGTVFRAWDPVIKRPVAIKVCHADSQVQARFLQEAELAGRLHHPNITTIYEFGTEGETPFLVQEYLDGEDLSDRISRGQETDLVEKIKILVGVAVGLEYAHRAGIVHRDIKPANVRVLENGLVKIMDFGIAKAMDAPSVLTGTGITVGSSGYMAPEQVCGDRVDARTDVFSFGVLAYELLSYRKPFANDNLFRLLEMIVKEDPEVALFRLVPTLPERLVEIVERAMRKSPEDRFPSMKELCNELVAVHPEAAMTGVDDGRSKAPSAAEAERLQALQRYAILDTPPEAVFDELAQLASQVCAAPVALVSLVTSDRQWVKAGVGAFPREVSRRASFCAEAILEREVMVVPDARRDARFCDSSLVMKDPGFPFYAGAPLLTPDGFAIGTLCVLDWEPRELSADQRQGLRILAAQVMAQLELRRHRRQETETSSEKLLLEVAGLSDLKLPGQERPQ
jgi:hypothetical protein